MGSFSTLKQAWIHTMLKVLDSDCSFSVEDYAEIRNYQVTFRYDDVYELKSDKRIFDDYLEMRKVFFSSEQNRFGHNYAETILVPAHSSDPVEAISQILQKNQTTRKAVMTLIPYAEMMIPCINLIQYLVRDNVLNITYYARGQDIYRKFPCDAMCIAEFGEKIAAMNHYSLGTITANIASAHIYFKDFDAAKRYIAESDRFVILTGNQHKYQTYLSELQRHGIEVIVSKQDIPEIQSTDWKNVLKKKAMYAYKTMGFPVWIDDVWLELEAYPLFPGAYTKGVWKQIGVIGMRRLLEGQSDKGKIICRMCRYTGYSYEYVYGENCGQLLLDRDIENENMPLNSLFAGEGKLVHRDRAIQKLINREILIIE